MTFPAFAAAILLAEVSSASPPLSPVPWLASATDDRPVNAQEVPTLARPLLPVPPLPPAPPVSPVSPRPDTNEIVVTGQSHTVPGDPLEKVNAKSFAVTQAVDRALVRPLAMGYQRIVPKPIRSGIRNFINNLREPVAFVNFLLQIKPGKAFETVGRFGINTTLGVAGLFDFAKRKPFKLPRRPNGFANTLGYYGVKPGPFLFLPLIGPTTLRDFLGDNMDRLVLPVAVGKPFNKPAFAIPVNTFSSLDQRAEFDEHLKKLHQDSDPYAASREDYLQSRQAAIDELHGKHDDPAISQPVPSEPAAN
jgi:phospholipid-binding lipoprotein MlaA